MSVHAQETSTQLTIFQILNLFIFAQFEVGDSFGGVDGAVVVCHASLHGCQEFPGHTYFSSDEKKVVDIPHKKLCN